MEKRTYTVMEAAEMLGISKSKAYGHIKNDEIPGVIHLGGRILIRRTVFDQWIDAPESTARGVEDKFVLRMREAM